VLADKPMGSMLLPSYRGDSGKAFIIARMATTIPAL
jgi:hypothetical protein